jgi:hypothetical protein
MFLIYNKSIKRLLKLSIKNLIKKNIYIYLDYKLLKKLRFKSKHIKLTNKLEF